MEHAVKDGPVDLPPVLVSLLNSEQYTPAPRDEFKQQLDNIQVGQQITLPSIDQRPTHYGEGYQEFSIFITEQMMEMWRLLSSNSDRPIRRVLSGPMGVGKSYLVLFLAAKEHAEGWLILYVSDTNELALKNNVDVAMTICARFLAPNKDILTVVNFEQMTVWYPTEPKDVFDCASNSILHLLLQQPKTRTSMNTAHSLSRNHQYQRGTRFSTSLCSLLHREKTAEEREWHGTRKIRKTIRQK